MLFALTVRLFSGVVPMGCISFQHFSSVSFHIVALHGHVRILCRAVSCSKVAHLVHGVGVRIPFLYSTLLWELSRSSSIVMLFVVGFFHIFRMHSCVCFLCVFIILPFDGLSAHVSICFRVRYSIFYYVRIPDAVVYVFDCCVAL